MKLLCLRSLAAVIVLAAATGHAAAQGMSFSVYSDGYVSTTEVLNAYSNVQDNSWGCSHYSYTSTIQIISPSSRVGSSSGSGLSRQTSLVLSAEEGDYSVVTTGQYQCSCMHGSTQSFGAGTLWPVRSFIAPLKYDRFDVLKGKHVYVKDSAYCNGTCQPSEWCSNDQHPWVYLYGWRLTIIGVTNCVVVPPYPRPSATRPECRQAFGTNVLFLGNECDG